MTSTKLDRSTTAKVQSIAGTPDADTYGNIAVSSIGPSLRFKYATTWYSVTGGPFDEGTGSYSAKRAGIGTLTASGNYSFVIGTSSTVAGNYTTAFGASITLSGASNIAAGGTISVDADSTYNAAFGLSNTLVNTDYNIVTGTSNSINGGNYNAVLGGYNALTSASANNLIGGYSNAISASTSNLIAGNANTVTSVVCGAITGSTNTVTGDYSLTVGRNNENAEDYAIVHGRYAKAIWPGARHFSGGRVDGSTTGASQGMDGLVLIAQTDDDETVTMNLDSIDGTGTNPLYCPDGYTIVAGVRLVGVSSAGIEIYDFNLLMARQDPNFNATFFDFDGGAAGSPLWDGSTANVGTVVIAEDAVNYKAKINVTGVMGLTTNWTAHIHKTICTKGSYYYSGS